MISENKLRDLLNENASESPTLDFKQEPFRLDNDHFKSKFIKDILSMANTPRDETSYIVIGVKAHQMVLRLFSVFQEITLMMRTSTKFLIRQKLILNLISHTR
jgi:hypothetical protein